MTNPQIPSYSGVTINITNPTMNAGNPVNGFPPTPPQVYTVGTNQTQQAQAAVVTNPIYQNSSAYMPNVTEQNQTYAQTPQAYPPQYYLNNYNYQNNNPQVQAESNPQKETDNITQPNKQNIQNQSEQAQNSIEESDLSSSQEIIKSLDEKAAKQKELEENGKQTRVVALTDEYIMSLENYLNNQNSEIRLMASKEVLKRLDEDKSRYDDAALNALLNKMLQDPQKLVRIAALSALSSGLASGNNYTIELLNNIQQNPNSSKEDQIEAANILLKMSAETEIRYVNPNKASITQQQEELENLKQTNKAQ